MATSETMEEQALARLRERAAAELASITTVDALEDWRARYLGRERGELTVILKGLGKLPGEQRKTVGQAANTVKVELEALFEARRAELRLAERSTALERERLDVTLPGRPRPRGHLHPLSLTTREITRIFGGMGFQVVEGPEVETDYYNFQALNMPLDHPSRDMQDTFWIAPGQILLRTQTSPNQIRIMEQMQPPVRAIVPGKVYRNALRRRPQGSLPPELLPVHGAQRRVRHRLHHLRRHGLPRLQVQRLARDGRLRRG